MMKNRIYVCYRWQFIFFFLLVNFTACTTKKEDPPKKEDESVKKAVLVSDLTLDVKIKGQNATHPYGDGSGVIDVTAKAKNVKKYNFRFGTGDVIENTSGIAKYTFKTQGNHTYTVSVVAISSTGHSAKVHKEITISKDYQLIWSDEFNTDGAPDNSKWNYDIGRGNGGWGNNESQYYTKRSENVVVADGVLKIIAKKENHKGSQYTSARLKTQDKFDFTYGKVVVRAKLPKGVGTWPAIWMLGSNITKVSWPACGEIDIVEHVGKEQDVIHSSLHTSSSYGATVNTKKRRVEKVSETFHIYSLEWTKEKIVFSIDHKPYYEYNPANKNTSNYPFVAPQFIILNIAMGGTFGGSIASSFTQSAMEVDYVRVYQYKK